MEIKNTVTDFTLTIQRGGSIAFQKTGVYPEFLIFHSGQLRGSWRLKLKDIKQNGVLKVNGQIAFHYSFDGLGCKMQGVNNGIIISEWDIEEIMIELRD